MFGYDTLAGAAEMTLYDGERVNATRQIEVRLLEKPDPEARDRGLITVNAPAALQGTKLLSWSTASGEDQQWLFLPRTERTRRIGDRGRKASFVNSDYTYEDMLKWQLDAYAYTYLGEKACPAGTCKAVEAVPTSRDSIYGKMTVYYDSKYRISQIDYYRKDSDRIWKQQIISEYTRVADTWQPALAEMTDRQAGTRTVIDWSDYRAGVDLRERAFSPNAL